MYYWKVSTRRVTNQQIIMVKGDIETLASKIVRDECVLFAGAGLSLHAGAPDWDSLASAVQGAK